MKNIALTPAELGAAEITVGVDRARPFQVVESFTARHGFNGGHDSIRRCRFRNDAGGTRCKRFTNGCHAIRDGVDEDGRTRPVHGSNIVGDVASVSEVQVENHDVARHSV
jgi:hypothetical protein